MSDRLMVQAERTVAAKKEANELRSWIRVALFMLENVQEGPEGTYNRQRVARLIRAKVTL